MKHFYFSSIVQLQQEYQDEEVTQKGYVKRLRSLIEDYLLESDRSQVTSLETELSDGDITEVRLQDQ